MLACNTVSMGVRFAVLAAPVVFVALILLTDSPPRAARHNSSRQSRPVLLRGVPPLMFSPWYAESLRDILQLEESDVARLEQQLRRIRTTSRRGSS